MRTSENALGPVPPARRSSGLDALLESSSQEPSEEGPGGLFSHSTVDINLPDLAHQPPLQTALTPTPAASQKHNNASSKSSCVCCHSPSCGASANPSSTPECNHPRGDRQRSSTDHRNSHRSSIQRYENGFMPSYPSGSGYGHAYGHLAQHHSVQSVDPSFAHGSAYYHPSRALDGHHHYHYPAMQRHIPDEMSIFVMDPNCFELLVVLPKRSDKWFAHFQTAAKESCRISKLAYHPAVEQNLHSVWKYHAQELEQIVTSVSLLATGIPQMDVPSQCISRAASKKVSYRLLIPSKLAYRIIGVKGQTIQLMRECLKCDIFVSSTSSPNVRVLCLVDFIHSDASLISALKLLLCATHLVSNWKSDPIQEASKYLNEVEMKAFRVISTSREEQENTTGQRSTTITNRARRYESPDHNAEALLLRQAYSMSTCDMSPPAGSGPCSSYLQCISSGQFGSCELSGPPPFHSGRSIGPQSYQVSANYWPQASYGSMDMTEIPYMRSRSGAIGSPTLDRTGTIPMWGPSSTFSRSFSGLNDAVINRMQSFTNPIPAFSPHQSTDFDGFHPGLSGFNTSHSPSTTAASPNPTPSSLQQHPIPVSISHTADQNHANQILN